MLQRLTFLLLALLLVASPLLAQTPPPAPAAVSAASVAPDTAAALHRLFAHRRHKSHVVLGVSGGALAVSAVLLGTANGYKDLGNAVGGLLGIMASVPVMAVNVVRTISYSDVREQRILLAWQHHRLPPRWSRRALSPENAQPQR